MLKIWNKYKFQAACAGFVVACALSAWAGYAVAQSACHAATLLIKNQYADEQLKAQQAYSVALLMRWRNSKRRCNGRNSKASNSLPPARN